MSSSCLFSRYSHELNEPILELNTSAFQAMKLSTVGKDASENNQDSMNEVASTLETASTTSNAKFLEMVKDVTLNQFVPVMLALLEKLRREEKTSLRNELLVLFGDLIKDLKGEFKKCFEQSSEAEMIESDVRRTQSTVTPVRHYRKGSGFHSITSMNSSIVSSMSIDSSANAHSLGTRSWRSATGTDLSTGRSVPSLPTSSDHAEVNEYEPPAKLVLTPIAENSQEADSTFTDSSQFSDFDIENMLTSTPLPQKK